MDKKASVTRNSGKKSKKSPVQKNQALVKTGIKGLDDVLGGGFPRDRIILAVGGPGCGKSALSMEYIYRGASEYGEPGVYYSFEESRDEIHTNAASFNWDFETLADEKKVYTGFFDIQPDVNIEVGEFNLEALFFRIESAISAVGARRLVLDGINNLLSGFSNERIVRSEIMRLFRWLKEKDISVLVTGEKGVDTWSKLGFEEYLCDGLIVLSNSVQENFTTRHLRVIKCRGMNHGTDEYPFLINNHGINIVPVINADFDYKVVSNKYVSSGINAVDEMLGPKGFIKGSTVLITGTSGTGKTSISAAFVEAACSRGEKAVYFAFEESADQVIRNLKSIGINLDKWVKKGLLKIHSTRSTTTGLEGHLVSLKNLVIEHEPDVAVVDPITAFRPVANTNQIKLMLIRLNDFLRSRQITTILTSLSHSGNHDELSDIPMSSLADTWVVLKVLNSSNERNNILQIMKSRGMSHMKQPREIYFTSNGFLMEDLYIGSEGLLAGSARIAQQMKDREADELIDEEISSIKAEISGKRKTVKEQMQVLENQLKNEEIQLEKKIAALSKNKKVKSEIKEGIESKTRAEGIGN